MGAVIAVLSGKGGTGKTTVCAGLGAALAEMGRNVLCIDLDVGLRNLDIALGMAQVPALAFTEGGRLADASQHPLYPTLRFFTAPVGQASPEAARPLVEAARQSVDFCLLDAPAGVGEGFRLAAGLATRQLLVTGPDPAALRDGARAGELLELMGRTDVRLVVNRVNPRLYRAMGLTVDDVMDMVGYPLLGLAPEDKNVPLAAMADKPLTAFARGGAAAAFRRMARRLLGQPVPLPKEYR